MLLSTVCVCVCYGRYAVLPAGWVRAKLAARLSDVGSIAQATLRAARSSQAKMLGTRLILNEKPNGTFIASRLVSVQASTNSQLSDDHKFTKNIPRSKVRDTSSYFSVPVRGFLPTYFFFFSGF